MEIADAVEKTRLVALLEFDAEYNILICKEHGYAVRNLNTHLRDEHATPVKLRRRVIEQYASVFLARPADVKTPPPFEPPFDGLKAPADALLCAEAGCAFASV
jgi:hypothetical protein